MTIEEYLRDRVLRPAYGAAPDELVARHRAQVERLERMYLAGHSLACDELREQIDVADALAIQIMRYHADGGDA